MKEALLITGATGAIGKALADEFCQRGVPLILACRNEQKGERLINSLLKAYPGAQVRLLPLNLEDEKSVTDASRTLADIALLGIIHNAGVMNRNFRVLPGGKEHTLTVNYYHPMILTELLLRRMKPGGVIVFTTSMTRRLWKAHVPVIDPAAESNDVRKLLLKAMPCIGEKDFSQLGTYGLSKRLITDYAAWLSKRLQPYDIRVNAADPGIVNTGMITMHRWFDRLADILFRPFIRSPRHGARPAVRAFYSRKSGRIFGRFFSVSLS